jgi:hypothetical protein
VVVLADKEPVKRDLDRQTRQSTRFAVLVMRDEDKAQARKFFQTPLIFSIHEAKGLEYDSIVLYRFVSDHRAEFADIATGVTAADLEREDLEYRRARDKADKSLEIYKFYVNALYVALTRAIRNIYLIESDTRHELLALLGVHEDARKLQVEARVSSLDDWQKEARKLELQGKQEQAEAIRRTILRQTPAPWPVFDEARLRETLAKVFRDRLPGAKPRQQLYEYAACYDEPVLAAWLRREADFEPARAFAQQRATLGRKHFVPYFAQNFKDILRQCEQHGIDHRTAMNQTPLMAAAAAGNVALAEALLERGADPELTDHLGRNALHWAISEAFRDAKFARGPFVALYDLVAPAAVDVMAGERLVRIDRHLSEYLLFQTMWALFKSRFVGDGRGVFDTAAILEAWKHLPAHVLRPERNKRPHLSSVLARNEVDRDYAYNRALFKRVRTGWYQFNPALAVRRRVESGEAWVPIVEALNLPLVKEFAEPYCWRAADAYREMAGGAPVGVPIAGERWWAERQAEDAAARARAEKEESSAPAAPKAPAWGTPAAKRAELERIRRQIEENARRASRDKDGEPE